MRLPQADRLGLEDLRGAVDFALAFAVVHELPSAEAFFEELHEALKPGAKVLLAEPMGHVSTEEFERTLAAGRAAGLEVESTPEIRRSRAAVLRRTAPA